MSSHASSGPEPITDGPLAGAYRWHFQVAEMLPLTPMVRRFRLTTDQLALLAPTPGQDLMLAIPITDGDTVHRRYSIRSFDPDNASVDIDVVLHGDGPGARWAATASTGDEIDAIGPRGKIVPVPNAIRHLFVGDPAGAPALLAMLESLPEPVDAHALLTVSDAAERQPTTAPDDRVTWLIDASEDVATRHLQELVAGGDGHVYLAGERGVVNRQRQVLWELGVPDESISPKAYWSLGAANAAHGEPLRAS